VLQTPWATIDKMLPLLCIIVGGASLMIRFVAGESMAGTDHDRVCHGHDGACLAPARGQALIQGRRGGPLGPGRRLRQRRQPGPQSPMALLGLAGAWCAGLSSCPGATPLHASRRAAVPNRAMSIPHSPTNSSPPR
jgi:hypothetical protein